MKQAIILAAGKSARYGDKDKLTETFSGFTLPQYAIKFCIQNNVDEAIIVINQEAVKLKNNVLYHQIINDTQNMFYDSIVIRFVFQDSGIYGPGAGLIAALPFIKGDFFVLMGDNFLNGYTKFTADDLAGDCIIGSEHRTESIDNLRLGYINELTEVQEKPHNHTSGFYFTGFAFFKEHTKENINKLIPSNRNEFELTDFINLAKERTMYDIHRIDWVDITFQNEIDDVDSYIKKALNK